MSGAVMVRFHFKSAHFSNLGIDIHLLDLLKLPIGLSERPGKSFQRTERASASLQPTPPLGTS